jgi:hypothetical protein
MSAYDRAVKLIGTEYFQEYCYYKIAVSGFAERGVDIATLVICEQSGIKGLSELLKNKKAQKNFNHFADTYDKWALDNPYMTVKYKERIRVRIK